MIFRNRTLVLVGLTSLLTDVSSEMVYPLLPILVTVHLGASKSVLGLIEGVAESIAQLTRVFSGAWSDRLGRRKPLTVAGYGGSAGGKALLLLASLAGWWGFVFVARAVDRLGKGIRSAPRDALIADVVPPDQRGRAFGFHRAMDTTGSALGVLIAYAVFTSARDGIGTVLAISVVPAVLGVLVMSAVREDGRAPVEAAPRTIPGDRRSDPEAPARGPIAGPLADARRTWRELPPRLKGFLLIVFLASLGGSSNQFLMLRAVQQGFSEADTILLYLLYTVVYLAASYPAGHLSDRVGRRAILTAGYAAYGVVYLGFALVGRLAPGAAAPAIWALFGIYGLHIGLTEGVEKALLVDLAPARLRATVLGLNYTIIGLGLLPASLVAGVLWDTVGPAAPFHVGAVTGLAAAISLWRVLRGTTPSGEPGPVHENPVT